jgi:hypothetical protein
MTLLARLFTLGIAREASPAGNGVATYLAPIRWIPASSPKPEDLIAELRDESIRGNDVVLQGVYGGAQTTTFDYSLPHAYTDVLGDHLRAMIGPDTLTAGIVTTLSATTTVGATSISTALSIPSGSTVRIDTGTKTEFFTSGTPTGAGPFTIPITAVGGGGTTLTQGHTSGVAVQSAATHTFAQDQRATVIPSYSLTAFDKIETRGYPGCIESDLGIKIDPKGAVSADAKWMGFPSATQGNVASGYTNAQPFLGWQWGVILGGVASTRGITGDWTFKRATEAVHASDGTQGPREIWPGAIELDYKLKAIFENNTDFNQFLGYQDLVIVNTLTQPLAFGGSVLTITSSKQKYIKFAPDFSGTYLAADIDASAAFNATDNGVCTVTLTNFINTAY